MPDDNETLAAISASILEVLRLMKRIEERLGHLEALAGMSQEPKWLEVGVLDNADIEDDVSEDLVGHYQSLQRRTWDPVMQKWVYQPEP